MQELSHRFQKAVLWPVGGYDDYGTPEVGTPTEIMVRWNTTRTEALDSQGNTITLDATAVVGQRIDVGSCMWLGTLANWNAAGVNATANELMEVKTYSEVPDLKNRVYMRTVGLMRRTDALPDPT